MLSTPCDWVKVVKVVRFLSLYHLFGALLSFLTRGVALNLLFLAQLKPSDAREVVEGLERPGSCINLVSLRPTVCSDVTANGLAAAAALTYHGKQME